MLPGFIRFLGLVSPVPVCAIPATRRWPLPFSALRRLSQRTPAPPCRVPPVLPAVHASSFIIYRLSRPARASPHGVPARPAGGLGRGGLDQPTRRPAHLWGTLCVHMCWGVSAPTGVGPRSPRHGAADWICWVIPTRRTAARLGGLPHPLCCCGRRADIACARVGMALAGKLVSRGNQGLGPRLAATAGCQAWGRRYEGDVGPGHVLPPTPLSGSEQRHTPRRHTEKFSMQGPQRE